MSIAICFNNKDPKPWAETLRKKLPDVEVEIYPDIKNYEEITFALCWKADRDLLTRFPNLKVVQSVGASVDHILNYRTLSEDIILSRIVDDNLSADMFEFVLAGIMSHIKRFDNYGQYAKDQQWQPIPYKSIKDVTIGVLGLGKIGSYVASNLGALGFTVKGWSRTPKEIENTTCYFGEAGLRDVLQSTDILINILPYTKQTEDILNAKNLKQLNPEAYLINVGRGEHLVENDLLDLLESKYLFGALLDVFRTEPLPMDHPFWQHEKIKTTPHIAAITNVDSASKIVISNYRNLQEGKKLLNVVSIADGY